MRIAFACALLAAGCGASSPTPDELLVAWQQPLQATDVCNGDRRVRCAWAWAFGEPPELDINPFVTNDYKWTLAVAVDADVHDGDVTMTFTGAAGSCTMFQGRTEWTKRPPSPPRGMNEPWALHVDATCSDPSGPPGLHIVADASGTRGDRPLRGTSHAAAPATLAR